MSRELAQQLDEVAEMSNRSRGEVFRRAIGLYKLLKEVEIKQGKIFLEEPGGKVRELVGL
jgi:predicted transcriptional regulator